VSTLIDRGTCLNEKCSYKDCMFVPVAVGAATDQTDMFELIIEGADVSSDIMANDSALMAAVALWRS